jgi:hypothetical protein
VVHKVDRFARNLEDHVTVRALLRRLGVELVSVVEPLDDSPQGRLTEGIHALMAEFYSANLAAEIRKGMTQKAKQGGWPHQAPLGYHNIRKPLGGRLVACIEPDPDRAHHILAAFQLYATGDWTLERLTAELAARGLCNRGRRDYPPKPLSLGGVAKLLANKTYVGVIDWNGVLVQGQHQPLVSPELFQQVQDLLAARSARGTRERKHHHYLKGVLHCAVCSRRYSYLVATGNNGRRYPYFYCLGTRPTGRGGCREPHIPAHRLEDQVERLYERIQLPHPWLTELHDASRPRSPPARATPPTSTSRWTVNCWAWRASAASCWRPTTPTPSTCACSAKNRPESASGPGPLKPAAAPSPPTSTNGRPSSRPPGGSPPTAPPPTATPTHEPASSSTARSSTASRSATATSPTWTTRRPSTCSLAGQGLNTERWWS